MADAWVSGRVGGWTVADRDTVATVRIGGSSGSAEEDDEATAAAPASATDDEAATDRETTGSASGSAIGMASWPADACRWSGRVGSGAWDVRLGTARVCATTMPAGALGLESWPSGVTIGGSGACPGTPARNGAAGATTGGGPAVRWIGGSVRQAPVGATGASARVDEPAGAADVPPAADPEVDPAPDVLRPNGHGRRTGLTPPRTGAD